MKRLLKLRNNQNTAYSNEFTIKKTKLYKYKLFCIIINIFNLFFRKSIKLLLYKLFNFNYNIITSDKHLFRFFRFIAVNIICIRVSFIKSLFMYFLKIFFIITLTAILRSGNLFKAKIISRIMNIIFISDIKNKPDSLLLYLILTCYFRTYDHKRFRKTLSGRHLFNFGYTNMHIGLFYLYTDQPEKAFYHFQRQITIQPLNYAAIQMAGRCCLVLNNQQNAAKFFKRAIDMAPWMIMAHQNGAARYEQHHYKPSQWEYINVETLSIYDNLGMLAEQYFHAGNYDRCYGTYQQLFDYQNELAKDFILPHHITDLLSCCNNFDPARPTYILPYEWTIQFGHMGYLDMYLRLVKTGWLSDGNHVLLAPLDKTANLHFLSYLQDYFIVITDSEFINTLFPYQRYIGRSFMAISNRKLGEKIAIPWTYAGAKAIVEWEQKGLDAQFHIREHDVEFGYKQLAKLGIPRDAWFVSFHVRESGYYAEAAEGGGNHRNAKLSDYIPAMHEILNRGGWVIRLGDDKMSKLGIIHERILDYAHSKIRSPRMDIFLLACSRFIVGTTSGLTNVAIAFNTPIVLVNYISNDYQMWNANTHYILKKVYDKIRKRYLTFKEIYDLPQRAWLVNEHHYNNMKVEFQANDAEEIRAAVVYKFNHVTDNNNLSDEYREYFDVFHKNISEYPELFGAGKICPQFLKNII